MNNTTTPRPLTEAELARAAELAPAAIAATRIAFQAADEAGERYRAAGYVSVGRKVARRPS